MTVHHPSLVLTRWIYPVENILFYPLEKAGKSVVSFRGKFAVHVVLASPVNMAI